MAAAALTWTPLGYARYATLSSAVVIATTAPTAGTAYAALKDAAGIWHTPQHAIIDVESQNVRIRDDGTAPTASEGQLLRANSQYVLESSPEAIRRLQLFETAASATVTIKYFY